MSARDLVCFKALLIISLLYWFIHVTEIHRCHQSVHVHVLRLHEAAWLIRVAIPLRVVLLLSVLPAVIIGLLWMRIHSYLLLVVTVFGKFSGEHVLVGGGLVLVEMWALSAGGLREVFVVDVVVYTGAWVVEAHHRGLFWVRSLDKAHGDGVLNRRKFVDLTLVQFFVIVR